MARLAKRIAFVLSDFSYPPNEGLHQQALYTIKSYLQAGHTVEVFGLCKSVDEIDIERLARDEGVRFSAPIARWAFPHVVTASMAMLGLWTILPPLRRIRKRLEDRAFDVIHLDGVATCGLVSRRLDNRTIASIIDPPARRRFRLARSAASLRGRLLNLALGVLGGFVERRLAGSHAVCHVVSESDQTYLLSRFPKMRVVAIPIQLPPECVDRPLVSLNQSRGLGGVIFVFADLRIDHMRLALERFLQAAAAALTITQREVTIVVLGRVPPPPHFSALASRCNAVFLDWLDDYVQAIDQASVVVLPDEVGTGMKNRTVQCMARSRAVVGAPTAFEGIDIEPGIHGLVASSPEQMVFDCLRILKDPVLRLGIEAAARAFAVERYSPAAVTEKWQALTEAVLGGRS